MEAASNPHCHHRGGAHYLVFYSVVNWATRPARHWHRRLHPHCDRCIEQLLTHSHHACKCAAHHKFGDHRPDRSFSSCAMGFRRRGPPVHCVGHRSWTSASRAGIGRPTRAATRDLALSWIPVVACDLRRRERLFLFWTYRYRSSRSYRVESLATSLAYSRWYCDRDF